MNYLTLLPVWDKLDEKQQDLLINTSSVHKFHKGNLLHSGSADCMGLFWYYPDNFAPLPYPPMGGRLPCTVF